MIGLTECIDTAYEVGKNVSFTQELQRNWR